MSDDFDRENDWLDDADDGEPTGDSDDDLNFDWLQDDDSEESTGALEGHLGVTGDLSWRQEFDDSPDQPGDEADFGAAFDWDEEDTAGAFDEQPELEDDLGWLGAQDDDELEDEFDELDKVDTGALDWMLPGTGELPPLAEPEPDDMPDQEAAPPPSPQPSGPVGIPLWLQGLDPLSEQSDEEDDLPDWMRGDIEAEPLEEAFDEEPEPAEAEPDWLHAADDLFEEEDEEEAFADENAGYGEAEPDWLHAADDLFEDEGEEEAFAEEDAGYGEAVPDWLSAADESFEEEAELDEPGPAWLGAADDELEPELPTAGSEEQAGEPLTPAWLEESGEPGELGFDDELFDDETLEPQFADDLLDARMGMMDTLDDDADAMAAFDEPGGMDELELPDLADLTGAGLEAGAAGDELPDWFTEEAAGDELPDWFTEQEAPAAEEPFAEAEFDDMDFESMFADLSELDAEADEAPAMEDLTAADEVSGELFDEELEPAAELAGEDDLFALDDADLDQFDEELEPAAELAGEDDLFALDDADLDQFDEELEPAAELAGEDDLFALVDDDFNLFDEELETAAGEEAVMQFADDLDLDHFDEDVDFDELMADEEALPLDQLDLREMGIEPPDEERIDWFAETSAEQEEEAAVPSDGLDWLEELDDLDVGQPGEAVPAEAGVIPAEELSFDDIDSFLSGYEADEIELPKTGELSLTTNVEFDDLFAEDTFASLSEEPAPTAEGEQAPDAPEWLSGVTVAEGETSATALVRKRKERPLEELPDRLQELREKGRDLPSSSSDPQSAAALEELLPGVRDVLAPASIAIHPEEQQLIGDIVLTPAQRQRMGVLRSLVGMEAGLPGEFDWAQDSVTAEAAPAPAKKAAKARRRRARVRFDRLVISLLLLGVMVLPFVLNGFQVGSLPPARFAAASREQAAFDLVDALKPGDLVLVGVEYGPTNAAELDSALDALAHHMLARGARPVLVGGNAVGLLHARNIMEAVGQGADAPFLAQLNRSASFVANSDYYVIRYLTANIIGLRSLGTDISRIIETDSLGNATGLRVKTLEEFALVVVITGNAEEMRGWSEQVLPLLRAPMVAVSSYSAGPLVQPYVESASINGRGAGLLIGYRDALTYTRMVNALVYGEAAAPTEQPTEPPSTEIPTQVPETPASTPDSAVTESVESTSTPTEMPPSPTATATLTPTPTATFTPSPTPTFTQTPTSTFTPTPTPLPVAVITSGQTVNVRSGPGTSFAPVGSLRPGTEILVLGQNEDGTWVNVLLGDGSDGWVAASLLEIQPPPAPAGEDPTPTPESLGDTVRAPRTLGRRPLPVIQPRLSVRLQDATPTPEAFDAGEAGATEEAVSPAEATPEATTLALPGEIGGAPVSPPQKPYQDARWYAMTLGIIVSALVIAGGSLVNIVRFVFRRRRS